MQIYHAYSHGHLSIFLSTIVQGSIESLDTKTVGELE